MTKIQIKFVYFDIGGVVVQDFTGNDSWQQLKNELGIRPDRDAEFEAFWPEYESQACLGRDLDTILPIIKAKFGSQLPPNYSFLVDGFVNRFAKNLSIWQTIEDIKKHYRIGLLTNMFPGMLAAIESRNLLPKISWDVIIDSSLVGLQKPDPKIFELAQQKAGLSGSKILFVENSPQHITAAKLFGWQTFLYDSAHPQISSQQLSQFILRRLS